MGRFRCHHCGEEFFPTDEDDLLSIQLSQAMGVEDVCPKCLPGQLRRELTDGAMNAHKLRLTDIESLLLEAAACVADQRVANPADVAATPQKR